MEKQEMGTGHDEVISLLRKDEYLENPHTYITLKPKTNRRIKKIYIQNQAKIYTCYTEHYYPTYNSPFNIDHEDNLKENIPVKSRYMDFYYQKQNKNSQPIHDAYCSNHDIKSYKSNIIDIDQSWPYNNAESISTTFYLYIKRKPNVMLMKSRYMDYLKTKNKKQIEDKTSVNPVLIYHRENDIPLRRTIPIYRFKRDPFVETDSDADDSDFNNIDLIAPKAYTDELDRRTRLCKFILDQQFPMSHLLISEHYKEESVKQEPSAKFGYMDIGFSAQEEKTDSEFEGECNKIDKELIHFEHVEREEKPQVKSRYMDFYYKDLDKRKTAICEFGSQSPDSKPTLCNYSPEEVSNNSTTHEVTTNNQIEIKSRYMDWDKEQSSEVSKKGNIKLSRLDWNDYHRLNTIHEFLDQMQYNFPSLCTTGVIGFSLEDRELKVLKVSNSNAGNASVWIDGGIHAREWIAPAVNTYIINHIVNNFNELPSCIQNKDWYFLPVMNPDGYEFSHTNYRMWRKNKAYIGTECVGVDLNRNFSIGWGGKGSSSDPKSPFYHGPRPFSEPESRAVRDMLKSSGIRFKVYITLHSFGEVILFPFAYRDELCPDYVRLLEGATIMSKAINASTGNIYKVGLSRDVMYGAAGTSCDWSYGEAKIPFCYLLELRSKNHKFRLPQTEIEETGKEILSAVMALMEFVDKYDDDESRTLVEK